jgi:hypothetical protein
LPYGTKPVPRGYTSPVVVRPYRPRARALPAPSGATALDRLRTLTDTSTVTRQSETVEASPVDAAQRIIEVLADWGYLEVAD